MFKAETGEPLAVMDGRLITEMRTAAASAVATQRLARADASVLAILGSGVQAGGYPAARWPGPFFQGGRGGGAPKAPAVSPRGSAEGAATAGAAARGGG